MLSKIRAFALLLSLIAVLSLNSAGTAQVGKSDASSQKTAKKRAYSGRLPNGWPKLGISDVQRKRIYAAQITERAKRQMLEKQIEELQMEFRELTGLIK